MGPRLGKLSKMSSGRDRVASNTQMDNQTRGNSVPVEEQNHTDDDKENVSAPLPEQQMQQQTVESKYKNVDLRPDEGLASVDGNQSAAGSSTSSACQPGRSAVAASAANNIIPCASTSLALATVPKLTVVEKCSKKRRGFKPSSTSGKRDFFGMRRSKKWPMMKLSSCCSKKEQEVEPPAASSLSCICTGFRRRDSETDAEPAPLPPIPTPEQFNRQVRQIGGVVPIIDLSLFNPADYPIDDEDERMRRQRAKEMAEGVELSLSARFGVLSLNKHDAYHHVHTQVDYVHCLVPDLKEITTCSFYWGKIDRYEAEKLLEGKVEGTFLLRDSAQEEYLFSVSFRRYGRSLHARIEQWNYSFSFDSHDPSVFSSPTVTGLIEHYKDPSSCMFFEPLLTTPLHRNFPFDLQHLARSVICNQITYDDVNALPLPKKLKVYCKEYHYKQRVRVRQLE